MSSFKILSTNRGAAKRILNVWHDSRTVRGWPLARLADELQKAVNEELISAESVQRALNRQSAAAQPKETEQAGDASQHDGHEGENNTNDASEPETDGTKEPVEVPTAKPDPKPEWDDQLDGAETGEGEGEGNDESGNEGGEGEAASEGEGDSEDESESPGAGDEGDEGETESEQEQDSNGDEGEQGADPDEQADDSDQDDSEAQPEQDETSAPDPDDKDARDENGDLYHEKLPLVLSLLKAGLNVSLVGPTGCGKSVMSAQIAHIMGRTFTTNGSVFSKYDIIGFVDGAGSYHATPLYDSYTTGGLHCFDEKDRSSPDAVVTFNGMIDGQKQFAFPNGLQTRHKDFLAVSCMNTLGLGATADYTAQKQDASAESRFVYVEMEYDHNIEKRIGPKDIVKRVWSIRAACAVLRIAHILPTRAIAQASAARALGKVSRRDIDKCILFKALSPDAIKQIKAQMRKGDTNV